MRTQPKLYQILEKAHIDTKIAVAIQDWIVDTIEAKRDQGLTNMTRNKDSSHAPGSENGIRFHSL